MSLNKVKSKTLSILFCLFGTISLLLTLGTLATVIYLYFDKLRSVYLYVACLAPLGFTLIFFGIAYIFRVLDKLQSQLPPKQPVSSPDEACTEKSTFPNNSEN